MQIIFSVFEKNNLERKEIKNYIDIKLHII